MEKRYENQHDVSLRLHNSILKYKDTYYYASLLDRSSRDRGEDFSGDDTTIGLHTLKDHKLVKKVDANDPDLDIMSLPLGYLEGYKWNQALYLARAPYRRQKQGICAENVVCYSTYDRVSRPVSSDTFAIPGFDNMLKNKYTHYEAILSSIRKTGEENDYIARPFNINFCVMYFRKGKKTLLQHNLVDIGDIDLESGLVNLYPEHNHSVFIMKLAELGVTVA